MAKITNIFVGDTWINNSGSSVIVKGTDRTTGQATIGSVSWRDDFQIDIRKAVTLINNGYYSNYKTVIPNEFVIRHSDALTEKLILNLFRVVRPHVLLTTNDLIRGNYYGLDFDTPLILKEWDDKHTVRADKIISIINTLNKLNQSNENKETRKPTENNRYGGRASESSNKKAKTTTVSRGEDESGIRFPVEVRKVRLGEINSNYKARKEESKAKARITQIQCEIKFPGIC